MMSEFMMFSLIPMTVAVIIGMTCALLGNFLVLRRQSLIGDAISHVALPGIVVSFLLTGMLSSTAMMLGAGASALVTVAMIELIRRLGRVEISAAMGVTFTSLFAVGVLLLEWFQAGGVHLDVEHALYGNLESLIWFEGTRPAALIDPVALADLPPQLARVAWVGMVVALFVAVFRRHLIIASFDPDFAASVQARPVLVDMLLVTLVAIAAIAAFEAVGSIIVIAMFICPAAAARLITDRLGAQIAWSQLFAVVSSVLGYLLAGHGPGWLGFEVSLSAAGMIASLTGVILLLACLFGPYRQAESARQES